MLRTALEANDCLSDLREPLSLYVTSCGPLKPDSSSLPTKLSYETLCHDSTPPRLNPDGSDSHLTVPLHRHMPPHILLDNSYHSVEPISTQCFQSSKHACSEEDLGLSVLKFIGVVDRFVQDE
jgi:hypothetical protein